MPENQKTGYPSKDKTHLEGVSEKLLNPKTFPISLFGAFMMINSKRLDEPAIQTQSRIYSKKELHDDVINAVKAFKSLSVGEKNRLAIVTPNFYEGIVLTLAANAIGTEVVYFNPLASSEEITEDVDKYTPDIIFFYNRDIDYINGIYNSACHKFSLALNYVTGKDGKSARTSYDYIEFERFKAIGYAYSKGVKSAILNNLFSKKVSIILQTSGSASGKPKGLPFNNEAVYVSMIYAVNSSGIQTNDRKVSKVLCILPYRLPYGWNLMFMNVVGGNCVVLASGATPEDIGNYYKYEPSLIYGTPVILRAFIDNTPEDADLSFLTAFFASGFSLPESLYNEAKEFFTGHNAPNTEIRNNYGIGEGLCIGTVSDGLPHMPGTSGRFWYGPDWVIVDDDLNEVKYGETGEALVYSKTLCKGYVGEPELTEKSFIDYRGKTYYRSGDYMSMDENGIVTFYGRRKRFYQPLGATDKVNCETIEKAVSSCPAVKNCAAVVVDDKETIQTAKVFAVLRDDYVDDGSAEEGIRNFISKILLDYQMPKHICILNEIPLMKSGKIDYTALEKM